MLPGSGLPGGLLPPNHPSLEVHASQQAQLKAHLLQTQRLSQPSRASQIPPQLGEIPRMPHLAAHDDDHSSLQLLSLPVSNE